MFVNNIFSLSSAQISKITQNLLVVMVSLFHGTLVRFLVWFKTGHDHQSGSVRTTDRM